MTSTAIVGQVLDANRRFYEALERLDMDAMDACWADDDAVGCVHPGGPWLRGRDAVMAGWEAIMANTGYMELEVADVEVAVDDPVARVTCVERITARAGEGASATAEVAATNLFVLGAMGWRIVLHHASPVVRGMAEAES